MSNPFQITQPIEYDLEVYPGWFLAGFYMPSGEFWQFEIDHPEHPNVRALADFITWCSTNNATLVGFNSSGYDDPVLTRFLQTGDPDKAFQLSKAIIVDNLPRWDLENAIGSVDLMPILPGRMSLKRLGVCLGHRKLQELPVPWDRTPTQQEREILRAYNRNDLEITRKLRLALQGDIDLRVDLSQRYGVDLRSKGEAALAETILLQEAFGSQKLRKAYNEKAWEIVSASDTVQVFKPSWWDTLVSEDLPVSAALGDEIFANPLPLRSDGRLDASTLSRKVYIDDRYYAMGVGGLHSIDDNGAWVPAEDEVLLDIDVASYYPSIILTQGLRPRQWGDQFTETYRSIVERRLAAKRSGDTVTAQILKISANGVFGKSSDVYSSLFDPQLTANVTVIGQLGLIVLIEMLRGVATVCSANTDGISILCERHRGEEMKAVIARWEQETGLTMEFTEYSALYQKDVNNYIALKADGGVKKKGYFVDKWPDLRHTPSANIVATAVTMELATGVPIELVIAGCRDLNQFILTQNVTGDWTTSWNGTPLGKVLRFYKSVREDAAPIIRTPGEGAKGKQGVVPESESCIPVEDLPESIPDDLDYDWYIDKAAKMLGVIRQPKRPGLNTQAEAMHRAGLRPCLVDTNATHRSRASVNYGETDFTSCPEGWTLGTATGDGLIARVWADGRTEVFAVSKPYPGKTREKVRKDHGFELIYGTRVPLTEPFFQVLPEQDFDQYYTPAELRRVRGA